MNDLRKILTTIIEKQARDEKIMAMGAIRNFIHQKVENLHWNPLYGDSLGGLYERGDKDTIIKEATVYFQNNGRESGISFLIEISANVISESSEIEIIAGIKKIEVYLEEDSKWMPIKINSLLEDKLLNILQNKFDNLYNVNSN